MQLSEDLPGVSLALSLHAPNQELRQSIVPSARAYKLDKLMAAVDTYEQSSRQKVPSLAPSCHTLHTCKLLSPDPVGVTSMGVPSSTLQRPDFKQTLYQIIISNLPR